MNKFQIKKTAKLLLATSVVFIFESTSAFAQTVNVTGNDTISAKLKEIGSNVKRPLDIAVGLLGLAGAFVVFFQYKGGKPEAKDNFIKLIIGLSIWYITPPLLTLFGLSFT